MDAVSYSHSAKQAQRIEKFIENPDSTSGIVTVPSAIAAGETITIPAGRTAVLPNVTVEGTLTVDGEVFVPSGATFGDLEAQLALKASLESPALTGTPTAPTAAIGTNTTQVATTAFVDSEISNDVGVANSPLVKTALNASGTAPIYACRAWVNFNGTGTVASRASGNVSSITDNGTGDYTVNFTTAMSDVNYSVAVNGKLDDTGNPSGYCASLHRTTGNPSITSVRVGGAGFSSGLYQGVLQDAVQVYVQVFR